ncbi:MAG: hypothetical protein JKX92_06975 [Porticoccaceae bacterium]|nr:hypothetical protein [Porticoccaceae bacterium]
MEYSQGFVDWYGELRQAAEMSDSAWLVSTSPEAHFSAYSQGLTPVEELAELDEMAQWRGCGCGGGA